VAHVVCGPEVPIGKEEIWQHVPELVEGVRAYAAAFDVKYDLYHSHYWMSGWVARELAQERSAPIIHMYHTLGVMKDLARGDGSTPEVDDRRVVESDIARFADAIVAATPADRDDMVKYYDADARKIHIVPPGVDLSLFHPIPLEVAQDFIGQAPDHRMILFVGRMDPVKGLDTLMRAMAIVVERDPQWQENACLCVVGGDAADDPALMDAEMARIDRLRHELGLTGTVTFLGPRSQQELPYYYGAAQVVVVPSRYESFGLVALEAMACGTPVIASNVGGLATLVRDGRTGFLVPDGDAEALAAKLLPLLSDPALRSALGSHGIATAEAYGWPTIAERVDALYDAVMRRYRAERAPEAARP
jgi:D-inositol-3-phosphate glycosyltransferase